MYIETETKRKLREMGVQEIVEAISEQEEELSLQLSFDEKLQIIVDSAYEMWKNKKIKAITRRARLRYPQADIRKIDFCDDRKISKATIAQLSNCHFIESARNIVFQGFTGSGKTYLGCAIAKQACTKFIRTYYIRIPDLEEQIRVAKQKDTLQKLIVRYANYTLLVLDEWLLNDSSENLINFLLEIMERRYGVASTIFCTQYKQTDWHTRLGGGTKADAILDRCIHGTIWIETGTVNMRAKVIEEQ